MGDTAAELFGEEKLLRFQSEIYSSRMHFRSLPDTFEQGRSVGFLNVTSANLERRIIAARTPSRILVQIQQAESNSISSLLEVFGYLVSHPLSVMAGFATAVLPSCVRNIQTQGLAEGWKFIRIDHCSSRELVRNTQNLQRASGITPLPGWHLRGLELPVLSLALVNNHGVPVGAGSIQDLETEGPRSAMGLGICIAHAWQRRGLGVLLNSRLLAAGLQEFGWNRVVEIVDEPAGGSLRMNERCGLKLDQKACFLFGELAKIHKT